MHGVDPKSLEFALGKIEDGAIFERFALDFLAKVLGYDFLPVGGIKDRGIDGLEHLTNRKGRERKIYQCSIEQDCEGKLERTLAKLEENQIAFEQLCFVTNRTFPKKDVAIDRLCDLYNKPLTIYDAKWLSAHVNDSQATVNAYYTFVDSYLHEFAKPGKSYVVGDLIADPRLFVFLRQQWDSTRGGQELDKVLADALILYSLEGTDADSSRFRTEKDVMDAISSCIKFEPNLICGTIKERLTALSRSKPRQVQYHPNLDAYCLPYETRLEIQQRNLKDQAIYHQFRSTSQEKLKTYLRNADLKVQDCLSLIEQTINRLFYQQGLEFANFVLKGENQDAFEKSLPDLISSVVDESSVILRNKEEVKSSLLMTIRDIVYNGTTGQKIFLQRLSSTYMMLFLLQCDPKLTTYFSTMASRLNVYVCTSIIIPALSEFYLEEVNRRHWNLLRRANEKGVSLTVNETIITELVSHFEMIRNKYNSYYRDYENMYVADEVQTLYIDDILIRAYFYAKMRKQVEGFSQFLENFVNPDFRSLRTDLVELLKSEFGIRYTSDTSLGLTVNADEEDRLFASLKELKSHDVKARTDAKLILTIYAIREKNNETDSGGIFGYKTWWLSKDTQTQKAVNRVFRDKYRISCYIRPDFLYNYISLSPSRSQVDEAYQELFPSMLGVNISFHLSTDVIALVQKWIRSHKDKRPSRLTGILRDLAEKAKSSTHFRTRAGVEHYLDEELRKHESHAE